MHYRLEPTLPAWAIHILDEAHKKFCDAKPFKADLQRLGRMGDRPRKECA